MRAINLFSGGLDSQLAVKLLQNQGIEVIAVHFVSPFFGGDNTAKKAAAHLGVKLITLDVGDEYMKLLYTPRYGFGKNHNPCIDCHAFMLRKAGDLMEELRACFIATGEVLGQRPMSQNKNALYNVEKLSGYQGLVLRPLSALLLPESIPEKSGWVVRENMLDINGRRRNRQEELAITWGLQEYPSPGGGCLLTQEAFSRRLKKYLYIKQPEKLDEIRVLKHGRHFYLDDTHLLIVGRNQSDNNHLKSLAEPDDLLLKVLDFPGPLALLRSVVADRTPNIYLAGSLLARYSDGKKEPLVRVKIFTPPKEENPQIIELTPTRPEEMPLSL